MIELRPPQWTVFNNDSRFRILVAGRRFGKTYLAQVELCRWAWAAGKLVWYVAPTYKQAKRIAWNPLKRMTQPYWASRPNETDLRIELTTGAQQKRPAPRHQTERKRARLASGRLPAPRGWHQSAG